MSSGIPSTAANKRVGWEHISEPETFWLFGHVQCSQGVFVRNLNNMLSPIIPSDRKLFTTYCVCKQKSIFPETKLHKKESQCCLEPGFPQISLNVSDNFSQIGYGEHWGSKNLRCGDSLW